MGSSASRSSPEDRVGINQAWDDSDNMSFWRKDKEKVNYKARLEHKRYLAQESPEPVFDISECALKNVPAGIYSRCKVARKEALLLQVSSLMTILIIITVIIIIIIIIMNSSHHAKQLG